MSSTLQELEKTKAQKEDAKMGGEESEEEAEEEKSKKQVGNESDSENDMTDDEDAIKHLSKEAEARLREVFKTSCPPSKLQKFVSQLTTEQLTKAQQVDLVMKYVRGESKKLEPKKIAAGSIHPHKGVILHSIGDFDKGKTIANTIALVEEIISGDDVVKFCPGKTSGDEPNSAMKQRMTDKYRHYHYHGMIGVWQDTSIELQEVREHRALKVEKALHSTSRTTPSMILKCPMTLRGICQSRRGLTLSLRRWQGHGRLGWGCSSSPAPRPSC